MVSEKIKILIAESFQTNIEAILYQLEKGLNHYNFELATTKKEFKNKLLIYKPDLILSNTIFTSFDGMSLLKIKKKLAPQTPFIFVSYPAREEQMKKLFQNGLTGFVWKDNISSLPSIIKQVHQNKESYKRYELYNKKEHSPIKEV